MLKHVRPGACCIGLVIGCIVPLGNLFGISSTLCDTNSARVLYYNGAVTTCWKMYLSWHRNQMEVTKCL